MSSLVNWVKKHPIIYYAGAVYRLGKTVEGRRKVIGILTDPRSVEIEKRGDLHKGMLVCEIDPVVEHSGFFAVFRRLLSALYFSDEIGAKPYVAYSKDFIYAEDHPVNESDDPFGYYFCPIRAVEEKSLKQLNAVIRFSPKHIRLAENLNGEVSYLNYRVTDEYLQAMASTCKKYIELNDVMEAYVQKGIAEIDADDRTLAVHCRGTDFNLGCKNHPVIVTVEDYFRFIDELLQTGEFDKIFLATDDENRLKKFIEKYGDQVRYYRDVKRTSGSEGVHYSTSNRENHHYWLGAEVIRDVYTMASCGGLVAGMSEVSIGARVFKQANGQKFKKLMIIDKGIMTQGAYFTHK